MEDKVRTKLDVNIQNSTFKSPSEWRHAQSDTVMGTKFKQIYKV
mgnify:CR=1 FL=1